MTQIIDNLTIIRGEELELINEGCLEVANGSITYADDGNAPTLSDRTTVLNGRGLLAIPGLIDAHIHLADSVAKDAGIGLNLDALVHPIHGMKTRILNETPAVHVSEAMTSTAKQMLASGVTTLADFREGGLAGVELARSALRTVGSRALLLGRPSYYFDREQVANASATLTSEASEELNKTLEIADGLGISGSNEYTDGAMKQISEVAQAKGKLLGIHACESVETVKFSVATFSRTEIERILSYLKPDFLVHLTNAGKEDLKRVSEKHIPVACCPRANSVLGLGFPPILELLEEDGTVALGTDNVMLASPDMFREMEYTSRMLRGSRREAGALSSKAVLKMTTVNAAKTLGLNSLIGAIEAGKRADIVFLDLNSPNLGFSRDVIGSVVHRAEPADVRCVMVDGEIKHGSIPTS